MNQDILRLFNDSMNSNHAGLTGVRLHDLRHTHASLLLKLNADPKTVSDRLGHASVQITMDVYSHLLPGVQEAAVAGLDALLEPSAGCL